MKKFLNIFFLITFLFVNFFIPSDEVKGKTLREYKKELAQYEAEYKANKEKEKLNNEEKSRIKANITNIQITITEMQDTMVKLNEEIEQLGKDIEKRNEQIKKIANFIQVSSGESAYLEYTFGAKDFTDFIYRMAVAEQLSNYNKKLIDEYYQLIKDNENKKIELNKKEESLNTKSVQLSGELSKLSVENEQLYETYGTLESSIKTQKTIIANYEAQGCSLDQDVETCINPMRDIGFWRPLQSALVTSVYGMRYHPTRKKWLQHEGIDLATGTYGTNIYSAANGYVVAIEKRTSCGGNRVFLTHNINGKKFTTVYQHLYQIKVSSGQYVKKTDVIGTVGGVSWLTPWDGCSTGAHLHFGILTGWVGTDYYLWDSRFYASFRDPAYYLRFPGNGGYYNGRAW